MDPYGYSKLDDIRNEIRLVTLLPGNAHEPIKIKLTVLSLVDEDRSPRRTLSLSHVQAHTPSTWIARETLEGRILYESSTTDDTTWTHPDPGFDHKGTDRWPVVRKNPPYEALSYVWGPSDDPISLSVREDDGLKTLHVRRNLFSALIHLRDPEQPNALWIDALCINQEDLAERSAQVLRIPDIYSFASRVIVWLGPAEKTTNLALSSMEYIGMQVETTADHCVVRSPDHIEPNWFSPKVNISYEPVKWTAIENLLDRSWFERFWVRQEVQLANEQSVIRCGSDEILWYHFRRALICLWCKLEIKDQPKLIMQLRSVGQLGEDWTQYDLIRLFRVTCELQCMDPRDKVYGLLGLAPFWFRERIKPRYDLSVGEVYKEAFLAYLQHTQRLDLLRYTFQSEMRVEGPSWVTDWCIPRAIDIAANGEFASGISRASYTLEGNVLSVMGLEFATVQSATEPAPENIDCILNFVRERWHPEDFRTGVYATGETMEDAFALTLCTNRTTSRFPTISSYIDPVHWKELLVNSQAATNASSLNALKRLSTKRLVTLENGYIGLGPTTVQAGDKLVILLGLNTPLLLRPHPSPSSTKYIVIGQCYVHGLMNGEALLGPLPEQWTIQLAHGYTIQIFQNKDTGALSWDDPRMEPLNGWHRVRVDKFRGVERTRNDPILLQYFRSVKSGKIMDSDPRLLPEDLNAMLESRGKKLRMFELV